MLARFSFNYYTFCFIANWKLVRVCTFVIVRKNNDKTFNPIDRFKMSFGFPCPPSIFFPLNFPCCEREKKGAHKIRSALKCNIHFFFVSHSFSILFINFSLVFIVASRAIHSVHRTPFDASPGLPHFDRIACRKKNKQLQKNETVCGKRKTFSKPRRKFGNSF